MRVFRTVCLVACVWVGLVGAGRAEDGGPALAPYQQAALEKILATIDPSMRDTLRPQFAQTLAVLNEDQVDAMLAGMLADDEEALEVPESNETGPAGADDLAYNQSQYEPAIRRQWAAQKAFDDFVDGQLSGQCPAAGTFAVFGLTWRHEVYPLEPFWPRASDSADLDVQIIGPSYAPQDGRYEFDFSKVRTDFDRETVENAIHEACAAYIATGERFVADANARKGDEGVTGGMELEQAANASVGPVRKKLEETLQSAAPAGDGALIQSLINARRVE